MNKFCSLLAGGALLVASSIAFAGQPLQLSDRQLDVVTAGAAATANATAQAIGDVAADTYVTTLANVRTGTPVVALGQATSQALAASAIFNASAASHTDASASLP